MKCTYSYSVRLPVEQVEGLSKKVEMTIIIFKRMNYGEDEIRERRKKEKKIAENIIKL